MIRAYIKDDQTDWDLYLGCLAGAYRSTPNESTKLTPNLLSIGREFRLPVDLVYSTPEDIDLPAACDHVELLRDRMHMAHEIARKHLGQTAKRSKEAYDIKATIFKYNEGDAVWCLHETRKIRVTPKLEKQFDGPFLVKKLQPPVNFLIQLDAD